jgi:hypothetical protein
MANSNTVTYKVPNFTEGMFMMYFITSQTSASVSVTVQDSNGNVYATFNGNGNTNPMANPTQGFIQLKGSSITVTVTDSEGTDAAAINTYSINNPQNGEPVGFGYALATEDATDNDFNDVWVSLTAWNAQG